LRSEICGLRFSQQWTCWYCSLGLWCHADLYIDIISEYALQIEAVCYLWNAGCLPTSPYIITTQNINTEINYIMINFRSQNSKIGPRSNSCFYIYVHTHIQTHSLPQWNHQYITYNQYMYAIICWMGPEISHLMSLWKIYVDAPLKFFPDAICGFTYTVTCTALVKLIVQRSSCYLKSWYTVIHAKFHDLQSISKM
jgi:hypothetical protein